MKRILRTPGKFIVGRGEIGNLSEYILPYGGKALLIALKEDAERVRYGLDKAARSGVGFVETGFCGECCMSEIDRIIREYQGESFDVIVGLGGGKALDTAKAVSRRGNKPLIIVPTIASTDAPCSALLILYSDDHVMIGSETMVKSPDIVLADSEVIARAPKRFLVAGMGDAFATYYEARACVRSCTLNYVGGLYTQAAWQMARLCRDILLEDSVKALEACEHNAVTPALENIIEANLYLSGIGFESVGCAAAHGIHNALTVLEETHGAMHGEKVAIGLLVQLILENAPEEELRTVMDYYRRVGLPTTLARIGIAEPTETKLYKVARRALERPKPLTNHAFPLAEDMIVDALKTVDSLGERF